MDDQAFPLANWLDTLNLSYQHSRASPPLEDDSIHP